MSRILFFTILGALALLPSQVRSSDSLSDLFTNFEISNEELMTRIDEEADLLFSIKLSEASSLSLEDKILEFYGLTPEDVFETPLEDEAMLESSLVEIATLANKQDIGGMDKLWGLVSKAVNNFVFTSNHATLFASSLEQAFYEISLEFALYEQKVSETYKRYKETWTAQLITSVAGSLQVEFRNISAFIGVIREWVLGSYKLSYSLSLRGLFMKLLEVEGADREVLLERLVKLCVADAHFAVGLDAASTNAAKEEHPELPRDAMYRIALFHNQVIEGGDEGQVRKSREVVGLLFERFVERLPKFLESTAEKISYEYLNKAFMIVVMKATSASLFRAFLSLKWKKEGWTYLTKGSNELDQRLVDRFERDHLFQVIIIGGKGAQRPSSWLTDAASQVKRFLPISQDEINDLNSFHPSFTLDLEITDPEFEAYNALYLAYLTFKSQGELNKKTKFADFDLFLDQNRKNVLEFRQERIDMNDHYLLLKFMNIRHFKKEDQKAVFVDLSDELVEKTLSSLKILTNSRIAGFVRDFMTLAIKAKSLDRESLMSLKDFTLTGNMIPRFYRMEGANSSSDEEDQKKKAAI